MPARDRADIQKSLQCKGFIEIPKTAHDFYIFTLDGKKTQISTFTSRGSNYKSYSTDLLKLMARQLKISLAELLDLIDCDLTQENYLSILKEKRLLQ